MGEFEIFSTYWYDISIFNNTSKESFHVKTIVSQGCLRSLFFFLLVIDWIMGSQEKWDTVDTVESAG